MKKEYLLLTLLLTFNFQKAAQAQTVTDIDGNVYNTVTIGSQVWMKENLKTTRYQDGSVIGEVEDSITWANLYNTNSTTSAWCYYGSDTANNAIYGKLYNWYAANDPRNVCPAGWHLPTDYSIGLLSFYLGGDAVSGAKLKAITLWNPNIGDNSSGFTALPGGYRSTTGLFRYIGNQGYFWDDGVFALGYSLSSSTQQMLRGLTEDKRVGWSVRCIADPVNSLPNENKLDVPIQIYPNPTTNQLFIETNGVTVEEINIYNNTGSLVSQTKQPQSKSIDISELANGVYMAEIKTKEASVKRRWVKM